MRIFTVLLFSGVVLAAEPTATDLAADLITSRAVELGKRGDDAFAHQLQQLADGLRAKRISLVEAQQVLALVQSLPSSGPRSPAPQSPAMTADQANAALDGHPMPPPLVAPAPPPLVTSAAVPSSTAPPPPAGPPPVVIGKVLAIEPGADGKPALLALATDAKAMVKEGQRLAVRRDHATIAVARVTKVSPDLTIALLIPGTWHDDQAEIRVDDEVAVLPE